MPKITIIGGGFSGAVTAVQLARRLTGQAQIDIVEPREMLGGGVAYSATSPAHRINVPASRMTVFTDDPTQFDRWIRLDDTLDRDPAALWSDGSAFPQRGVFGRYIAELVHDAALANPKVRITHHHASATALTLRAAGFAVALDTGAQVDADLVILAVSHPPPAVPRPLLAAEAAGAPIVANPWADHALDAIAPEASVLIVGTGLTMADVVAALDQRGHRGPILAISRRGLLSRGHVFGTVPKRNHFETSTPSTTALGLSRAVRQQVREAAASGVPWQAVFDDVRANAARLWDALDTTERRRLVRHLRPFWDVHRFRIAPQAEAAIARRRAAGRFTALAASLRDAAWDGQTLQVRLRPRGGDITTIQTDAIVVTTGPAHGAAIAANPALASLSRHGLIRADPVGLGLDVDARNHAIGADGTVRRDLFVVGPLARGRVGELMGLPQVSDHAEAVAIAAAQRVG